MKKTIKLVRNAVLILALAGLANESWAQVKAPKFGKGIQILGQDSTYYAKVGFRFQNLFVSEWDLVNDDFSQAKFQNSDFMVRRSRLKFDGWAVSPKLKWKLELALSNRDNGGGATSTEFNRAANIVLDAYVDWNFWKSFSIKFGQGKLPGNRERVISSGNLQLVDRSRLNSRYNIDRDVGFTLSNWTKLGKQFFIKEVAAVSQGEGRNITSGHHGGFDFTYRVEFLPFGKFQSKGDYIGSSIKKESKPKLAIGVTYDNNQNAVRNRGQLGSFIQDSTGAYFGKDLNTFMADLMFKYQGLSVMAEYADKSTGDNNPFVLDGSGNKIGTFYTGTGLSVQAGFMFKSNWEPVFRYTDITPQSGVANAETQYTFGLNKFVVGHKLKIQTDLTYRSINGSDDQLFFRTQLDIHF